MASQSSGTVECPNCRQPVRVTDRRCRHCNVDLALAAACEEHAVAGQVLPMPSVTAPEALVPRLGRLLVEAGEIGEGELEQALIYQRERAEAGESILIGQVMVDLGFIDRRALDEVVAEHIFQLQAALQESNQRLEHTVCSRTVALQQALVRLSELNQMKSNFVSTMSHELRTPLQYLVSYTELLESNALGSLNDEQSRAVGFLSDATHRLYELIEELLTFSSATQGEFHLNLRPLEIEVPVETAVRQSMPKVRQRQLAFQTMLAPYIPAVRADEEKITWVIGELLDNAIKFTPAGGRVALQAMRGRQSVKVSVLDTGIGIPQNRLDEIFEPFHQLDGSITRGYGGMGLGLSLAQQIMQAHGSEIEVESRPGSGSVFSFALPALIP
jgi:signal transduction histidine kinase